MKKFTLLLLASLFCFSAAIAAGCAYNPQQQKNFLKYKNGNLNFTLNELIFFYTPEDLTYINTSKNLTSSYINHIEEKEEIKDFLDILFAGYENGFNFYEISKEDLLTNGLQLSYFRIGSEKHNYTFFLNKDENKICYIDKEIYYCADTGDFSALYGTYILNH